MQTTPGAAPQPALAAAPEPVLADSAPGDDEDYDYDDGDDDGDDNDDDYDYDDDDSYDYDERAHGEKISELEKKVARLEKALSFSKLTPSGR